MIKVETQFYKHTVGCCCVYTSTIQR